MRSLQADWVLSCHPYITVSNHSSLKVQKFIISLPRVDLIKHCKNTIFQKSECLRMKALFMFKVQREFI